MYQICNENMEILKKKENCWFIKQIFLFEIYFSSSDVLQTFEDENLILFSKRFCSVFLIEIVSMKRKLALTANLLTIIVLYSFCTILNQQCCNAFVFLVQMTFAERTPPLWTFVLFPIQANDLINLDLSINLLEIMHSRCHRTNPTRSLIWWSSRSLQNSVLKCCRRWRILYTYFLILCFTLLNLTWSRV